jgi:hypothetical protein
LQLLTNNFNNNFNKENEIDEENENNSITIEDGQQTKETTSIIIIFLILNR